MNSITKRLAFVFLGLALALAPRPVLADGDESGTDTVYVVTKDGKTVARKGEVKEEWAQKVILSSGGKETAIKREEINRVEYGGVPAGLTQADQLLAKGNDFDNAAAAYRKVAEDGSVRGIFKQRAYLGLARSLAGAGKFDEAADAFQAVLKAPHANLERDAIRECVRALIRGKNAPKALTIAKDAKAQYRAAELPEDAQDEAQLLEAEAIEANGNYNEARTKYNVLTNSKDAKVKGRAMIGAARCAVLAHEGDRAEGMFRAILGEKDVERDVRCGAATGLGQVLQQKAGKDFQKLRAAASAYAQALAVQFPGRGQDTDARETALHECARIYDQLADLCTGEKDAKGKELYQGMARQLREELVKLYKTSPYKQEDEQKLAKAPEPPAVDAPKSMKTAK